LNNEPGEEDGWGKKRRFVVREGKRKADVPIARRPRASSWRGRGKGDDAIFGGI
jgi:hypothetical protein